MWNETLAAYEPVGQGLYGDTLTHTTTFDIGETGNGGYVAVGTWSDGGYWSFTTNLWLIRTDSNRKLQVSKTYNLFNVPSGSPSSESAKLFDIKIYVTRDDGLILCGGVAREEYYSPWLAKISSTGTVEWSREYPKGVSDRGPFVSVVETGDRGFFAVGSDRYDNPTVPLLVRTDGVGNVRWKVMGHTGFLDEGYVQSGMVTSGGAFVVVGQVNDSVWLAKFATESQFWSSAVLTTAGLVAVAVVGIDLIRYFKRKRIGA